VWKWIRVSENVHEQLANSGRKGETFSDIIKRLFEGPGAK
jgi:predicted CopG family antitoxin